MTRSYLFPSLVHPTLKCPETLEYSPVVYMLREPCVTNEIVRFKDGKLTVDSITHM